MKPIDKNKQEKIIRDFEAELAKGLASATAIRNKLSSKYELAYSTIHKITTRSYRTKEEKVDYDRILKEVRESTPKKTKKLTDVQKTYIFLGWEIRVGVDNVFLDVIDNMAKEYGAEVFVTSLWPKDVEFLPNRLQKYSLLMSDLRLNNNLVFKYVPTHALVTSPLAGWSGAFDDTVIMPGLVKEVQTEKTDKLCKQLMTTGSLGRLNAYMTQYKHIRDEETRASFIKRWSIVQNRRGGKPHEIAKNFTVPTALIVNVIDNNLFFSRYVTMEKQGVVYDLGKKFTKDSVEASSPSCMVLGDSHAYYADEKNMSAVRDMILRWGPESVVIQDVFDGASINHHEMDDYAKVLDCPTLSEEAEITKAYISEICQISKKVYYLESNHDDFLVKYLAKESNYRFKDNYQLAIDLRSWQLRSKLHPIRKLLDLDSFKNLKYCSVYDNLYVKRVLIKHGHEGISGSRVGFRALQRVYNRYVQGHTHTPEVFRNSACVGTSSRLQLNYNFGASGWLNNHVLIQPDSSIQSITVIDGNYPTN